MDFPVSFPQRPFRGSVNIGVATLLTAAVAQAPRGASLTLFATIPLLVGIAVTAVYAVRSYRSRGKNPDRKTPIPPPPDPPNTSWHLAGKEGRTNVLFRHGTVIPTDNRHPDEAADFATAYLTKTPAPIDCTIERLPDNNGWAAHFTDRSVHLRADEVKHTGTAALARQARAKLFLDAHAPAVAATTSAT